MDQDAVHNKRHRLTATVKTATIFTLLFIKLVFLKDY